MYLNVNANYALLKFQHLVLKSLRHQWPLLKFHSVHRRVLPTAGKQLSKLQSDVSFPVYSANVCPSVRNNQEHAMSLNPSAWIWEPLSQLGQGTIFLNVTRQVRGSNVGRGTDYPDGGSSCFSSVPSSKYDATPIFQILFNSVKLSTYDSLLYNLRYRQDRKIN